MTQVPSVNEPLRVFLCGQLALEYETAVVREPGFPGRQGRHLWAYLALNRRRPVARDELAGAIWGDDIPDAWDSTLSAVVSRLRTTLRPLAATGLCVRAEPGCYVLDLPGDVFVDYEPLEAVVDLERAAEPLPHGGGEGPAVGVADFLFTEVRKRVAVASGSSSGFARSDL